MRDSTGSIRTLLAVGLLVPAMSVVCLAAETYPYVGVVSGDSVYVRSGDSTSCYPVMKVNKGQRLTVQGESSGWLKIAAPTGTYSWVDKNFVQRTGDQGIITADRVWVRAGSTLSSERSAAQCVLNKGDTVSILGEDETFFKILTPDNASLYIAAKLIVPENQAGELAAITIPEPIADGSGPVAASQPTHTASATPGIITRSTHDKPAKAQTSEFTSKKTTPAPAAGSDDLLSQFYALESQLKVEMAKPADQRNFDSLAAKYKALAEQNRDEAAQAAAQVRIKDLANLSNTQGSNDAVARANAMFQKELDIWNRPRPVAEQTDTPRGWDAKGVLKTSFVFTGRNTAKLYRLVDPSTDAAVAYLQDTPQLAQTLESLLGRYIAVRAAQKSFRPDWNVYLIVPADVVIAEGGPANQSADVASVGDEPAPAADTAAVGDGPDDAAAQPAKDAEEK